MGYSWRGRVVSCLKVLTWHRLGGTGETHKHFHHRRDISWHHGGTSQTRCRFANVFGAVSLKAAVWGIGTEIDSVLQRVLNRPSVGQTYDRLNRKEEHSLYRKFSDIWYDTRNNKRNRTSTIKKNKLLVTNIRIGNKSFENVANKFLGTVITNRSTDIFMMKLTAD
jgi:hypothetical protein